MSSPKHDWTPTNWEILTPTCRLTVSASGTFVGWNVAVIGERVLVSGQFASSGNVNTDLKTAQAAAAASLTAFSKTIAGYAAEVSSL